MICYAKIIKIDDIVEEEVVISLGDKNLVCFLNFLPEGIMEEGIYRCEISLEFLDDIIVHESNDRGFRLDRIGNTFSYNINGLMHNGAIVTDKGAFFDDSFLSEYGYLDDKFVNLKVDRISLNFLL